MSPEEAISRIKNHNEVHSRKEKHFAVHITEALNMAVDVLEKQIPKKPKKEILVDDEKRKSDVRVATKEDVLTENNHSIINHCPNCNEWVTVQKYLSPPKYDLYCRNCGQALDWSDTE